MAQIGVAPGSDRRSGEVEEGLDAVAGVGDLVWCGGGEVIRSGLMREREKEREPWLRGIESGEKGYRERERYRERDWRFKREKRTYL